VKTSIYAEKKINLHDKSNVSGESNRSSDPAATQ